MPKNAAERLQKIEKDIKTVISIYEISKEFKHGKFEAAEKHTVCQVSEKYTPESSKDGVFVNIIQRLPSQSKKKHRNFSARSTQVNHSQESLVTTHLRKPTSVTSSKSMIIMRESDCMWQQNPADLLAKSGLTKPKTLYNLYHSRKPITVMSPNKIPQTSEILQKNNFSGMEETKNLSHQSISTPNKNDKKKTIKSPKNADMNYSNSRISKPKLKKENQNVTSRGNRPVSQRKKTKSNHDISFASQTKNSIDNVMVNHSPTFYLAPKKTIVSQVPNDNFLTTENSDNSTDDSTGDRKRQNFHEEDEKVFSHTTPGVITDQEISQPGEGEEMMLSATELCKKIEKNYEKLEKMKISKELALNIAKHMKNKYDEIQKSKDELLEKLQTLEKSNERLNLALKQTNEGSNGTNDDNTQGVAEEIALLKSKLLESQKEFNEELYEKQKIIEKIQKERHSENMSDLKNREILTDELQRVTGEKMELLSKLNQTLNLLRDRESQIEKLNDQTRQLEEEVQNEAQNLKTKEKALQETTEELENLRKSFDPEEVNILQEKIKDLEKVQNDLIQQNSEYEQVIKSNQEQINELKGENEELKSLLENEKEGMRIKIKIIEDQQETIKQLKEKSEETKNIIKRNESLERILNIERQEKLELQEAVECLKRRKEELKKKVRGLENGLFIAPQAVLEDLQKTQDVLQELEDQVQIKQKEWAVELQLLLQAKEQACNVAEFTTKKLMEKTDELQRQSQAYKCLQKMFNENIASRKKQTRAELKKCEFKEETKVSKCSKIPGALPPSASDKRS